MIVNLEQETLTVKGLGVVALIKKENTFITIEIREEGFTTPIKTVIVPASTKKADKELLTKVLNTPLDDLDLSVRTYNCIKAARIDSLIELVERQPSDLRRFRNFGQKSISEIEQKLEELGLSFGMDVPAILRSELTF